MVFQRMLVSTTRSGTARQCAGAGLEPNPMPDIEERVSDSQLPSDPPRWRARVREALQSLGGEATLQAIYRAVEEQYPEALTRKHWKAKIRQVLQQDSDIERNEDGAWRFCPFCKDTYVLKSE